MIGNILRGILGIPLRPICKHRQHVVYRYAMEGYHGYWGSGEDVPTTTWRGGRLGDEQYRIEYCTRCEAIITPQPYMQDCSHEKSTNWVCDKRGHNYWVNYCKLCGLILKVEDMEY